MSYLIRNIFIFYIKYFIENGKFIYYYVLPAGQLVIGTHVPLYKYKFKHVKQLVAELIQVAQLELQEEQSY